MVLELVLVATSNYDLIYLPRIKSALIQLKNDEQTDLQHHSAQLSGEEQLLTFPNQWIYHKMVFHIW